MSKLRFSEFKTYVREEFVQHLPYTLFGVAAGLMLTLVFAMRMPVAFGEKEFHLAHFFHILCSAAASAAIFRSYRDSMWKAIPIAYLSSVVLCTFSDILIPVLGLKLFGYAYEVHVCFLEHPPLTSAFAVGGAFLGMLGLKFFSHCNRGFHLLHMVVSTAASTLYLLTQMAVFDMVAFAAIGVTLFLALSVPCIIGDVILPLCFVSIREDRLHEKVHHHH